MIQVALSFFTALLLASLVIPPIIRIARILNLWDEPGERSSHRIKTPALGGIAIFFGLVFSLLFWTPPERFAQMQFLLGGLFLLFLIGVRDDLLPLSAWKKLLFQTVVSLLLIFKAGILLPQLDGFLGCSAQLPDWLLVVISLGIMLALINAFNLIDGIDGLAGSLGILALSTFGLWFLFLDAYAWAILAFSGAGAVFGFLVFNMKPARIFMGDGGSMLIGLVISVLFIQFLELNNGLQASSPYKMHGSLVVALGLVLLPLLDAFRLFFTRIWNKRSPFVPDRQHIHHLLIDSGLKHVEATGILSAFQFLCIVLVLALQKWVDQHLLLVLLLVLSLGFTYRFQRALKFRRPLAYLPGEDSREQSPGQPGAQPQSKSVEWGSRQY